MSRLQSASLQACNVDEVLQMLCKVACNASRNIETFKACEASNACATLNTTWRSRSKIGGSKMYKASKLGGP